MSFKTTRKDHGADKIRKLVGHANLKKGQPFVAIGVFGDKSHRGESITLPTLAAVHEFGTENGHIPARSFMRSTFKDQLRPMAALSKELHRQVIFEQKTVKEALSIIGEKFVTAIKNKIRSGIPPKLAKSTIERKGSTIPLIDTGQLINSITYKVHENGDK